MATLLGALAVLVFLAPTLFSQTIVETDFNVKQALKIPTKALPNSYDKLTFLFHQTPSVYLSGFIVAKQKGFYAEAGLPPIDFQWNNDIGAITAALRRDEAQFVTNWFPRAYRVAGFDRNIVSIGVVGQQANVGLVIRKDLAPNVRKFEDLHDITFCVPFRMSEYPPLLEKKLGLTGNTIIPIQGDGRELLRRGAVCALFCRTDQVPPFQKYSRWRDQLLYLPVSDTGIEMPDMGIGCRRDFLLKFPHWCELFVRASYRGWLWTLRHREQAMDILRDYYNQEKYAFDETVINDQLNLWTLVVDAPTESNDNGNLPRELFDKMRSMLLDAGLVTEKNALTYDEFFFPVMLPETMERIKKLQEAESAPPTP